MIAHRMRMASLFLFMTMLSSCLGNIDGVVGDSGVDSGGDSGEEPLIQLDEGAADGGTSGELDTDTPLQKLDNCDSARVAHIDQNTKANVYAQARVSDVVFQLAIGTVVRVVGGCDGESMENLLHPQQQSAKWIGIEFKSSSNQLVTGFMNELFLNCQSLILSDEDLVVFAPREGKRWPDPVLALDTYEDNGELSAATMSCLWSNGYRHLIANIREKPFFEQQVQAALSQGMSADAYVYIYFDRYQELVGIGLQRVVDNPKVRMLWLDVEGSENPFGFDTIIAALHDSSAMCMAQGVRCGFYSSKSMWSLFTNNTSVFADYPFWDAQWDKKANIDNMIPYGGWQQREGKQFWGWGWESLVECNSLLHRADPDIFNF